MNWPVHLWHTNWFSEQRDEKWVEEEWAAACLLFSSNSMCSVYGIVCVSLSPHHRESNLKLSCFLTCMKNTQNPNSIESIRAINQCGGSSAVNLFLSIGMGNWINMTGNNTLSFVVYLHVINDVMIKKSPPMNIHVLKCCQTVSEQTTCDAMRWPCRCI